MSALVSGDCGVSASLLPSAGRTGGAGELLSSDRGGGAASLLQLQAAQAGVAS